MFVYDCNNFWFSDMCSEAAGLLKQWAESAKTVEPTQLDKEAYRRTLHALAKVIEAFSEVRYVEK